MRVLLREFDVAKSPTLVAEVIDISPRIVNATGEESGQAGYILGSFTPPSRFLAIAFKSLAPDEEEALFARPRYRHDSIDQLRDGSDMITDCWVVRRDDDSPCHWVAAGTRLPPCTMHVLTE